MRRIDRDSNFQTIGASALPAGRDLLVCIFQRGAADGLNSLVPYGDANYAAQRGALAVPVPGQLNGAIDLDGFFGLHPALMPLKGIFDLGDLALVHATGFPHGSRSHFAAQGLVERGVTDSSGPDTGWLGRHLNVNPMNNSSAFRTVAISGNVPVVLQGANEPLAVSNLGDFGFDQEIIDSGYTEILSRLYRPTIPYRGPASAALAAIDELQSADLDSIPLSVSFPNTPLGNRLEQTARLAKSNLPVEVVCLDSDDWDHHENLPVYINQSLTQLAEALNAFYLEMGTLMQSITVLVYTEFGRRVASNASNGVDHGTGSLCYLMGGGVHGGSIYTDWPGLANGDLENGEDLRITTDLREVLIELLDRRLGGTNPELVFPGFSSGGSPNIFSPIV